MERKIKVLSVKQPWAWLIVNGYKDIENRTWRTKYRGLILIHASKRFDMEGVATAINNGIMIPYNPDRFHRGGIVGSAVLVDCVESSESKWFCGPYGFVLIKARTMDFIPLRGKLGLFNLPMERWNKDQKGKEAE